MGTLISVDVAQALLSQRVSALAAVNREKRLEREQGERDKSKIQGAIERGVDGAAGSGGGSGGLGGPSANGRNRASQAASASPLADLDAQLRAGTLRSGVPEYYTGPKVAATPRGGKAWILVPSDAEFRVKTRGLASFNFAEVDSHKTGYASGLGPSGSNALTGTQEPMQADGGFGRYQCTLQTHPIAIRREPPSLAYTIDVMFKLPPSVYDEKAPLSAIYAGYGNYGNIEAGQAWTLSGDEDDSAASRYAYLRFNYGFSAFVLYISNDVLGRIAATSADDLSSTRIPSVNSINWQHAAIVQTPGDTPGSRNVSFYHAGARIGFHEGINGEALPQWGNPDYSSANIGFSWGNLTYASEGWESEIVNDPALGHGLRFTPRALYTGDTYTPPTSITALA